MVENAIYRYNTIIGRSMGSRTLEGQRVEVQLALSAAAEKPRETSFEYWDRTGY